MKKKTHILKFAAGLIGVLCFVLASCGADEEALFMENGIESESATGSSRDIALEGMEAAQDCGAESVVPEMSTDSMEQEVLVTQQNSEKIKVHVCGAVLKPGVYELELHSRVIDAVTAAGGMTQEADEEYVNLATVLEDGSKVRVPTKEEVTQMSEEGKSAFDSSVITTQSRINEEETDLQKVNINTADMELLCTLPGIGQTRAESILTYRNEHGAFSRIEDIMLVSGIKESSFQKIKDKITVK